MSMAADVRARARGKWPWLLEQLGIDKTFLNRRNGPCPACGGTDRFRFTDKDGDGRFICSPNGAGCGAGDGFDLIQRVNGWTAGEAFARVREIVGEAQSSGVPRHFDPKFTLDLCRRIWRPSRAISAADPAGLYLGSRGINAPYPEDMRFVPQCRETRSGIDMPAMVALVRAPDGQVISMHRTYLTAEGQKADIAEVRQWLPGSMTEGAAIRLGPYSGTLGIAEGIETALRVKRDFGVPCWAAGDAGRLARFIWPDDISRLIVFADNDRNGAGQAAGWHLGHRIGRTKGGPAYEVTWPTATDTDWADDVHSEAA